MKNKKMYFLHIPKTGGMTVAFNIVKFLLDNKIKTQKSWLHKTKESYKVEDCYFLQSHEARSPKIDLSELSIVTVLRDPLERSVSHFIWAYKDITHNNEKYERLKSLGDKIRYFLLEDSEYFLNRNLQSKFISCNIKEYSDLDFSKPTHVWEFEETEINNDLVIKNINSFEIVGTADRLEDFIFDVSEWFYKNHSEQITVPMDKKITSINKTEFFYDNNIISVKEAILLLKEEDIKKFKDLNSIDYHLYEYILNKNKK